MPAILSALGRHVVALRRTRRGKEAARRYTRRHDDHRTADLIHRHAAQPRRDAAARASTSIPTSSSARRPHLRPDLAAGRHGPMSSSASATSCRSMSSTSRSSSPTGLDGELRAFYNVCRHRAGQVALSRGNRKSLQCRYHGWTYGLDGTLRACPEMEETEDFDKADFGLVPVRVEAWGPFVFVNLDPSAPPLAEMMGAIPAEVAAVGYDVEQHAAGRAARLRRRVQLEGVRRQLPRGLPPADRAPAALQGARLRRLPGRGVPLLLEAARADP